MLRGARYLEIVKNMWTSFKPSENPVASTAQQAAHTSCLVAMVNGESAIGWRLMAYPATALLRRKHFFVLSDGDAVLRFVMFSPRSFMAVWAGAESILLLPFARGRMFIGAYALFAAIRQSALSAAINGELRTGIRGLALAAPFFGYNVLSHGVNLSYRFAKWLGSFGRLPRSFEPFCIIA